MVITLFSPIYLFAQSNIEKDILSTKEKVNGVYRTFREFRTNSPSINGTLKITKHRIKVLNEKTGKFENISEDFWGACVNDTIFVFLREALTSQSPHIYSLDFLGRYCYFSDFGSYMNSTYGGVGILSSYKAEYIVNINNGIIYKLDKKLLRQILEKDMNLLKEFENENKKGQVFKKYIEIINLKHKDDIKAID